MFSKCCCLFWKHWGDDAKYHSWKLYFYVPISASWLKQLHSTHSYWQWVIIVVLTLTVGLVASSFLFFKRPGTKILATTIENLPGVNYVCTENSSWLLLPSHLLFLGFWICLQTCQKILLMNPVSIVCYLKKYQIVPRSEWGLSNIEKWNNKMLYHN